VGEKTMLFPHPLLKKTTGNHNWFLLEPNSQTFTTSHPANLVALNRIKNQLEIFTQAGDQTIWKTWWT
jgi:hypothetical protein